MHPVRKKKNKFSSDPRQVTESGSQKALGRSEKSGKRMDKYSGEDHSYVSTYTERERTAKTWGENFSNFQGSNTVPNSARSDWAELNHVPSFMQSWRIYLK